MLQRCNAVHTVIGDDMVCTTALVRMRELHMVKHDDAGYIGRRVKSVCVGSTRILTHTHTHIHKVPFLAVLLD